MDKSLKFKRRWEISELRLKGLTFKEIGEKLKLSSSRIRQVFIGLEPLYRKYLKEFCEECGQEEKYRDSLSIHHKDHNHENNNPKNLITLCSQCHASVHAKERIKNPIRKSVDWEGYILERRIRSYKRMYPNKIYPFGIVDNFA